jgi:carboxymethylenebutenolidase
VSTQTLSTGTPVTIVRPAGNPQRGIVVLPDAGGLSPTFDRIAGDLAEWCSAVVGVVEPFPGKEHLTFQERLESALGELREDLFLADATETADLLDVEPVAVLGVCVGGALALRAAPSGRFDRAIALYGMVHFPERWAANKGDPLQAAATATVPMIAIAGTADQFISQADLDELEQAGVSVTRVPDAKHGFVHDPALPSYDPDAAIAAWASIADFLGATGADRVSGR